MSKHDPSLPEDELELYEARKAVAAAQFAKVETDATVAYAQRVNSGVITIVRANGFVEKFRAIVQGST